jgi:hypothetical protein
LALPEGIFSVTPIKAGDLMERIEDLTARHGEDYACIGFRMGDDGQISEDMLLVIADPYCEYDDPIEFEGNDYDWDPELFDVRSIKAFHVQEFGTAAPQELVFALRYYLEFSSYFDGRGGVGGKWTWGGNRERFAAARNGIVRDPPTELTSGS